MLPTERSHQNLAILASFKNNKAAPDLLKQYTGWGGLGKAIYTPDVYRELRKSLTAEEITSLKQTFSSAYYTPIEIVKFIYGCQLALKIDPLLALKIDPSTLFKKQTYRA